MGFRKWPTPWRKRDMMPHEEVRRRRQCGLRPPMLGYIREEAKPVTLPPERAQELRDWLLTHQEAWSGWPTYRCKDGDERGERIRRLVIAGLRANIARCLESVEMAIADLRARHRREYVRHIREEM